jgi:anti-anti-sigma factor
MFYDRVIIEGKVVIIVELVRATIKEAEEFKTILSDEIDTGTRNIIVDLCYCEFIDSTFLGALVVSLKRLLSVKGTLKLCNLKPAVQSMFELTRMYKVFEIYDSLDKALASFES